MIYLTQNSFNPGTHSNEISGMGASLAGTITTIGQCAPIADLVLLLHHFFRIFSNVSTIPRFEDISPTISPSFFRKRLADTFSKRHMGWRDTWGEFCSRIIVRHFCAPNNFLIRLKI